MSYKQVVWSAMICAVLLGPLACSTSASNNGGLGGSSFAGNANGSGGNGASGNTTSGGAGGNGQANAGSGGAEDVENATTRLMTTNKLDVLFVVDNSFYTSSMQQLLSSSAAAFIQRLVNPRCIDSAGSPAPTQPTDGAEPCAAGYEREFARVQDMHIGAITSSLGAHGGETCAGASPLNDKAHLLPTMRTGVKSFENSGFLSFNAAGSGGETNLQTVIADVSNMILAAGSVGCGYEAPLEAMYRFLNDPEPPAEIIAEGNKSVPQGLDQTLLNQRTAFLRGDSAVAIVLLTDENDCSIRDDGPGLIISTKRPLWRSTSACEKNPNDACCRSCGTKEATPPAGCDNLTDDVECRKGTTPEQALYSQAEDDLNLRCWDQRRRFGFDLLYPINRYVEALSKLSVGKRDGTRVPNPLFVPAPGKLPRASRLVSLTGIVGVPWQDVSKLSKPGSDELRFLRADELFALDRWKVILGEPLNNVPPSDPLMIETWRPRTGVSPIVNAPLAPETSTNPAENPVNGHEYKISELRPDDLQYACIYALETPVVCTAGQAGCACTPDGTEAERNRPLCQPPTGGPAGSTQYFGKAHPGLRSLAVLRGLGERGIVGSACPRTPTNRSRADYAYIPILDTLAEHLGRVLR